MPAILTLCLSRLSTRVFIDSKLVQTVGNNPQLNLDFQLLILRNKVLLKTVNIVLVKWETVIRKIFPFQPILSQKIKIAIADSSSMLINHPQTSNGKLEFTSGKIIDTHSFYRIN